MEPVVSMPEQVIQLACCFKAVYTEACIAGSASLHTYINDPYEQMGIRHPELTRLYNNMSSNDIDIFVPARPVLTCSSR
jgi:hypothetical protein